MIIANFESLTTTPLRKQALLIAEAGLTAVTPVELVKRHFAYSEKTQTSNVRGQKFDLSPFKEVIVAGLGVTALPVATAIREILGTRAGVGVVTNPAKLDKCAADELVLCVVADSQEASPGQENTITAALATSGASLAEIGAVRKHMSQTEGGQLAKLCYPATVISLVLSNVPGGELGLAAGGPTVKDETTAQDAAAVLKKYNILEQCGLSSCDLVETPKEDKYFQKVRTILFASRADVLAAMREKADDLGFPRGRWNEIWNDLDAEVEFDGLSEFRGIPGQFIY
jgi:glycerate-2-kinase